MVNTGTKINVGNKFAKTEINMLKYDLKIINMSINKVRIEIRESKHKYSIQVQYQ